MRVNPALLLALTVAVATACDTQDDADDFDTAPATEVAPPPVTGETMNQALVTGQFESVGDAAVPVQGTAELRRQDGLQTSDMELHVRLTGLAEGDHAWHIHQGACGSVGSVVLPLSGTDGLDDDLGGDDEAVERTVTMPADKVALLSGGQAYSVNVHAGDADNPGAPIACATLQLPADFGTTAGAATGMDTTATGY